MLMPLVDILGFKNIDKQSDNLKELLIAKLKSLCVGGKSISCDVYSLSAEEIKTLIDLLEKEQRAQIIEFFIDKHIGFVKEFAILKEKEYQAQTLNR